MESYLKCEQDFSLLSNIPLSISGHKKTVNMKVATALVLGDIQGGDKICCRSVQPTLNGLSGFVANAPFQEQNVAI